MTTNYTATVEITTPTVTLNDFTSVVPAGIGVNVHGGATGADINTFDIGPTGDSNILLQTLDAGNHEVLDGVCHNSADGTVPPYGVHGIYDKAFGTLVENIEFHHHPNGQGYSPRYANRCKACLFHDTPFCIGLFNYQGATTGAGGTLRIRDAIFYAVPSGGYIFYSDGVWRDASGTILGTSLISVEIDHATIDVRGVVTPFDFSQCANDVYLTNSIIISDSGLPLSSIITPPTGGAAVHLDGSIVLDSADAATYLGPAPTFTPIAVGGSPVIGTAVASPPGCFAEWGSEGDVGATQSGSPPPGPPPLPGPATPSIGSLGLVGSAPAFGTDTVVIPLTGTIPRSDPSGGATLIVVTLITDDPSTNASQIVAVVDDAAEDPFYAESVIESGLNSYVEAPIGLATETGNLGTFGVFVGLILNPLDNTNSLTVTASATYAYLFAFAHAYTGINVNTAAFTGPAADASFMFSSGFGVPQCPLGYVTCVGSSESLRWNSTPGPVIISPAACSGPTDWAWQTGTLALYWNFYVNSFGSATGAWTWADADILTQDEWDDVSTSVSTDSYSMVFAEQVIAPPQGSIDISGSWATVGESGTEGAGAILLPGPGPTPGVTPPAPGAGTPVFNTRFRAGA